MLFPKNLKILSTRKLLPLNSYLARRIYAVSILVVKLCGRL
jgi:hypothetical protein